MLKSKKLLSLLLALSLLLGIVPFSSLVKAEETTKVGYIFETNVNIRKDATTSSERIDNVSKFNVEVIGSKKDTKGTKNPDTKKTYVWYKIRYESDSKTITGYVREDLIEVTEVKPDKSFEEQLKDFPKSYHKYLTKLHALYPNWQFKADNISTSFASAVAAQDHDVRKIIDTSYNSWRSMRKGSYNWDKNKFIKMEGNHYGASREVIAYYMDPRNFLDANDIYIFLEQSYDSKTQTVKGIEKMVDGTFMDAKITKKGDKHYGKRFAEVILYAAKQSKVNAYVLVSTIIQEQGRSGSKLSKGTSYNGKTVYNYFNYMASGSSSSAIINNGAKYAYSQKWFTPTEALVSGAKKYGSGYINEKQDTYYYKNFNVRNPDNLIHQYAQHVADTVRSAVTIRKTYADYTDLKLTFRIPVFKSMPETVSKLPAKNSKYNNYYFENLKATGLTKFNRYTTSYTLTAKSDLTVTYELPKNATYAGESYYKLKKGENKIKIGVKSQTGYVKEYTLKITASKDLHLLVIPKKGETLAKKSNGKWYHYVDGKTTKETTLVKYNGSWYYIKNGILAREDALVKYNSKWYYIVNGKLDWNAETMYEHNGELVYIKGGKWDKTIETLYKHNGTWLYINNGVWDKETETLIKYNNKWYYAKDGVWCKDTTMVEYNKKWYYVVNGKWNTKPTTLFEHEGDLIYINKGKWDKESETLVEYEGKLHYVKEGKWTKSTKIFEYEDQRYYVKSGIVQSDFTGEVEIKSKTYNIENGKVV